MADVKAQIWGDYLIFGDYGVLYVFLKPEMRLVYVISQF